MDKDKDLLQDRPIEDLGGSQSGYNAPKKECWIIRVVKWFINLF